jgi:hypothetical protein
VPNVFDNIDHPFDRWDESRALDISDDLIDVIEESWASERLLPPYHVYLMARVFPIPSQFREVTAHGDLTGCVSLPLFQQYQFAILEPAFRTLEADHAKLQGISTSISSSPSCSKPRTVD